MWWGHVANQKPPRVCEGCMEGEWRMHRGCVEGEWRAHGGLWWDM